MMRILMKLSAFAVSAAVSGLAQSAPFYQVSWGVQSVPISPWVSVATGLMLLFATYAFIRRRAGQGLFMLATATLVGGLALHTDNMANAAVNYFSITSPNGSHTFDCAGSYHGFQNNTGNPITLTITPFSNPTSAPLGGAAPLTVVSSCQTGTQLAPGEPCIMACAVS